MYHPPCPTGSPSAWRKSSRSSIPRPGSCARTSPSCWPRRAALGRADQARDAPVDRRGRHQDLRRRRRAARRDLPHPPRAGRRRRPRRAGASPPPARIRSRDWKDQVLSPGERYENIVEELQQLARSLLIFGLHVHVAVPDRHDDDRPDEHGAVLPAAPAGAVDQLAVLDGTRHRPEVVPHHGVPALPAHRRSRSLRIVERVRELRASCSSSCTASTTRKKIWWDVRPHPTFGTLEFRVCDVPTRPEAAVMIAALCQAIVVKLHKLYTRNQGFRLYRRALIEENKWRAARWGLDGKLIDFGKRAEVPMRDLALELLEFVDDVVDELGSREAVELRAHRPRGGHQRRSAARGLPAHRRSEGGGAAPRPGNTRRRRRTEEQDDEDRAAVRP